MTLESTEAKDWSQLFAEHRGQWVALADDEITVIAAASTAKAALAGSASKGVFAPILYRVPDTLDNCVRRSVSAHPHRQANDRFRGILPFF
jgi:hypothetical protein